MNALSVVIITRNEENNIADCIRSAQQVSNDIIVVDTGSEDHTIQLAKECGARTFSIEWNGYGASRNFGAQQAKNNWIMALDADERIDTVLADSIKSISFTNHNIIYQFRRQNYLGAQKIRFGTLGFETIRRLYNRNHASWDLTFIHEKLISDRPVLKSIRGHVEHYGLKDLEAYKTRAILYAQKSAEKYFLQGRKTNGLKKFASPFFNSIKSYIFRFGFLDGKLGFTVAKMTAYYSWLKYHYLQQLHENEQEEKLIFRNKPKMETSS